MVFQSLLLQFSVSNILVFPFQYIHPSSQVSGYQVQGGGTTTGTWPNSYYITPGVSHT